eukprot:gnl/Dysnectes_brevis/497_a550_4029.p2 GENE.gnl/Dysnectes_brevis/497_a550_4029~~gnl/Dysnectes_brevis/497_a550_4029.p2  ORF type:complete len:192 (-),score=59.31 gnl/Dysnectes_brevis/497_a550_4029:20-595(-)
MGLFDWFFKTLSALGLWSKKAKIVFLGLDNAGKSTLLAMLKFGAAAVVTPTQQPTSQELKMGSIRFHTFDLGGHEVARELWDRYYTDADAVVYLVDSSDPTRFAESRKILHSLLASQDLAKTPFLILGNKIDLHSAVPTEQLIRELDVAQHLTGQAGGKLGEGRRPLEVFMCSVINKQGYREGFQWLSKYL